MITPSVPPSMIPTVAFAIGAGLGTLVVRRGIRRARRDDVVRPLVQRMVRASRLASTDLDLIGRSLETVTLERLLVALAGSTLPIVMFAVTSVGGVPLPGSLVFGAMVLGSVAGYQLPARQLRTRAALARRRFRTSLSAYLDLVAIMLAGGAGIETALFAAARIGDGPAFRRIAGALEISRTSQRSPWDTLAELGREIGVTDLPELAATVRLGGEQGARMTASLVTKASSLRAKQLAEVEAEANAATEKMGLPMVMLFLGFLVLLGFPAMHMINAGFDG